MSVEIKRKNEKKKIEYKGVVKYGIPRQSSTRKSKKESKDKNKSSNTLTNAEILAILEKGSIVNNLPARPLLKPVMEKHKDEIKKILKNVCSQIVFDNKQEADRLMNLLAFKMETWTKAYFTEDNGWAPNAPITINGDWMKNKVSGKPVYIKGKKSDRPMIDTGELRRSIRGLFLKE